MVKSYPTKASTKTDGTDPNNLVWVGQVKHNKIKETSTVGKH